MDVRDACASCQVNFISLSLYLLTKNCVEKKDSLSLLSEPYLHIYMRGLSGQEMNIAPNARLINLKGIRSSFLHLTFGTFLFRNSFYFQLQLLLVLCIILHSYSYFVKELLRAIHTNSLTRHPQSGYPKELFATRWGFRKYFVNLQHHVNSEHRKQL